MIRTYQCFYLHRIQQLHECGLDEHLIRRALSYRLPLQTTDAQLKRWINRQTRPPFSWYNPERWEFEPQPPNEEEVRKLSLTDLQSVYVLAAMGVAVSVVTFTLEVYCFVQKRRREK